MGANQAATGGGMSELEWDTGSNASGDDYFSQERRMIADQARLGNISQADAGTLDRVLSAGVWAAAHGHLQLSRILYHRRVQATLLRSGLVHSTRKSG